MILATVSSTQGFIGLLLAWIVTRSFYWFHYRNELEKNNADMSDSITISE